jgi:hypothetical protein
VDTHARTHVCIDAWRSGVVILPGETGVMDSGQMGGGGGGATGAGGPAGGRGGDGRLHTESMDEC